MHVRYGPVFRAMPRDVPEEIGKEAALRCNVDSNPPASIVWLQEGSNKVIFIFCVIELRKIKWITIHDKKSIEVT